MNDAVLKGIKEGCTLKDLEKILCENGNNFSSEEKLVQHTYETYWMARSEKISKALKTPLAIPKNLDFGETEYKGIRCKIYGIVHDNGLIDLDKRFVDLVREECKKIEESGELIILEQGFSESFGLNKTYELQSQKKLKNDMMDKGFILEMCLNVVSLMYKPLMFLLGVFNKHSDKNGLMNYLFIESETAGKSITRPEYFLRFKNVHATISLPEPLDMQARAVLFSIANTLMQYSLIMTDDIRKILEKKKPTTAHIFVGALHETQIQYLLSHGYNL